MNGNEDEACCTGTFIDFSSWWPNPVSAKRWNYHFCWTSSQKHSIWSIDIFKWSSRKPRVQALDQRQLKAISAKGRHFWKKTKERWLLRKRQLASSLESAQSTTPLHLKLASMQEPSAHLNGSAIEQGSKPGTRPNNVKHITRQNSKATWKLKQNMELTKRASSVCSDDKILARKALNEQETTSHTKSEWMNMENGSSSSESPLERVG